MEKFCSELIRWWRMVRMVLQYSYRTEHWVGGNALAYHDNDDSAGKKKQS